MEEGFVPERCVAGIDPGSNGGIAVVDIDTGRLAMCVKMPSTPKDILDTLMSLSGVRVCYVEDVGYGMPGQSSKATATFARHNGHLEMALLAAGIPVTKITPGKWQRSLSLSGVKGETKTQHKNRIRARMQSSFPTAKVTLWAADAMAIAQYARYNERQTHTDNGT